MRRALCLAALLACTAAYAQSEQAANAPPGTAKSAAADPVVDTLRGVLAAEQQGSLPQDAPLERIAAAVTTDRRPRALSALRNLEERASDHRLLLRIAKAYDLLGAPGEIKRIGAKLTQQAPNDPMGRAARTRKTMVMVRAKSVSTDLTAGQKLTMISAMITVQATRTRMIGIGPGRAGSVAPPDH